MKKGILPDFLWVWVTLVLAVGVLIALLLIPKPPDEGQVRVDKTLKGLQHKKPHPCRSTSEANCVVIEP